MDFCFKIDDLSNPRIAQFLEEHLDDMRATTPPESIHALDLEKLRQPEIIFWSVWQGEELAGCGALKRLSDTHAELKSMRTARNFRGMGLGTLILEHILREARTRGFRRVSLETGSMDFFAPARALYAKHGFEVCEPFEGYWDDPNSVFMSREI
ncbi:MAG: GNAT family N-acetyltransferase [Anaerolineaceae bacterium]|nr:GNAT family N-acetyltransferase [Anaerolineaceae bacterium]